MAFTTIDDPSEYFHTRLYSGNNSGSGLAVTNDANSGNFQPDWVWIKRRDSSGSHGLHDSNRGSTKRLKSDSTEAEDTNSNILASFDSNGFTIGDNSGNYNASGTYVAWQWKANGGTTSSNSNGSITSTVQANTTAGFSIVTYTGDQGTGSTVGHGLGVTPKVVIVKPRNGTTAYGWRIYTEMTGNTNYLLLNATDASYAFTDWNNTSPTSSVFTVNSSSPQTVNESGTNYIAYCFAEIQGYSKFGSYTASGNADGPFIYTGFKPAFVIFKRTDGGTSAWQMHDRTRETVNDGSSPALKPNQTDTEFSKNVDFLSNGIKIRDTSSDLNGSSGQTYIYLAFAEHPFVSSKGVPVTAR